MIRTSAAEFIATSRPALNVTPDATDALLTWAAKNLVRDAAAEGRKVTQPDALATLVTLRSMARG